MNSNEQHEYLMRKFSHELRNPLTSLYSTIQLLANRCPEIKNDKYYPLLLDDINYMMELLNDFSHFTSERLNISDFSLNDLLLQVSGSFETTLHSSKVDFSSNLCSNSSRVSGDKIKLQEVFRNLLKNAFEACDDGGEILLISETNNHNISITIQDTGRGITPEQMEHIFEPFVTYKQQGSGLGLPICDQIVRAHHGKLTLSSTPGVGTSVTIILPTQD